MAKKNAVEIVIKAIPLMIIPHLLAPLQLAVVPLLVHFVCWAVIAQHQRGPQKEKPTDTSGAVKLKTSICDFPYQIKVPIRKLKVIKIAPANTCMYMYA